MELWQAVTAVSGAVVALVVVGSAAIGLFNRPFTKLRGEIDKVRDEGSEAHNAIGGNIRELGQELKALINASTEKVEGKVDKVEGKVDKVEGKVDKVEGKVDKLSEDLTVVREKVSHIDGGMPYIRDRLGKLEG